ncbi:hypothetical protein VTJ04DRAFT_8044 [Mycothermus thermophilus]|uniref:uncharacterized protein n=1 Tax=Humicola insolens TaxID=85995 RepID=UPI0037429A08
MGSLPDSHSSPPPPKPWVSTPLIYSPPLSRIAGCNIYLKLENVQPSGSFKSRGIGNMMYNATQKQTPNQKIHFFSSSGGNAGLACALTSSLFFPSSRCTIVVPTTTSPLIVAKLRDELGAEVIQTGESWVEADTFLRTQLLDTPAKDGDGDGEVRKVYVPPFDHPDIWTGVSTLVDELARDVEEGRILGGSRGVDAVVCNVGGGGLVNGIMLGLERNAKRLGSSAGGTKVVAVETEGADSLHASVRAGELVTLPAITSIATSLGARRVSEKTWEWWLRKGSGEEGEGTMLSVTVTDREAAEACLRFLDDARMLIEVSCGATLATVYNGGLRRWLGKGLSEEEWRRRNVVLVVCGGSNVSLGVLEGYKEKFGL